MRIWCKSAISVAALCAASGLIFGVPGAGATQGQAVLAGQQNAATYTTSIVNTNYVSLADCTVIDDNFGLKACGQIGLRAQGTTTGLSASGSTAGGFGVFSTGGTNGIGVFGQGGQMGVSGHGYTGGTGVYGDNSGSTGIGVHGKTGGTGAAVFGEATGDGIGVYATSKTVPAVKGVGGPTGVYGSGVSDGVEGVSPTGDGVLGRNTGSTGIGVHGLTGGTGSAVYGQATANGVGVAATSTSGTALQVTGKAKFSRSAIVSIPAGSASTTVSLAGVTAASMVVATAQQNGTVFVKAAVPAGGSFKIFLTGNAPAGGLKVAYFVLN